MTQKELLQNLVEDMTEEQATQLINIFYIINNDDDNLTDEEIQAIKAYKNNELEFITESELLNNLGIQ
ncbi:hypothetical protein J7S27_02130 [Carnobacteriaceae bacterium zg-C25]|nr:hypothetical protein J7S27_02130 [Carnobacteriaceae bacterium zg-C25]